MGFAVSSMLAFALAGGKDYPVAFTGDGSFMMNPQILIDGVQHGLRGMIVCLITGVWGLLPVCSTLNMT